MPAGARPTTLQTDRPDHIVRNAPAAQASAAWYERALGLQREDFDARTGRRVALRFGRQKINLRPRDADPVAWFTGARPQPGSGDLCFVTPLPVAQVLAHWAAVGVVPETAAVARTGALGPMESVYCRDPDGHLVGVAHYGP